MQYRSCQKEACLKSGAKKDPQSQKIARTAPKNFLNNSRGYWSLPSKTRVLRQITPESSPERSAKSLSHSFFVVPFLSPMQYLSQNSVRNGHRKLCDRASFLVNLFLTFNSEDSGFSSFSAITVFYTVRQMC